MNFLARESETHCLRNKTILSHVAFSAIHFLGSFVEDSLRDFDGDDVLFHWHTLTAVTINERSSQPTVQPRMCARRMRNVDPVPNRTTNTAKLVRLPFSALSNVISPQRYFERNAFRNDLAPTTTIASTTTIPKINPAANPIKSSVRHQLRFEAEVNRNGDRAAQEQQADEHRQVRVLTHPIENVIEQPRQHCIRPRSSRRPSRASRNGRLRAGPC